MQSQQDSPTILQGSFNYPTMRRVRFGPGSIESLRSFGRSIPAERQWQ